MLLLSLVVLLGCDSVDLEVVSGGVGESWLGLVLLNAAWGLDLVVVAGVVLNVVVGCKSLGWVIAEFVHATCQIQIVIIQNIGLRLANNTSKSSNILAHEGPRTGLSDPITRTVGILITNRSMLLSARFTRVRLRSVIYRQRPKRIIHLIVSIGQRTSIGLHISTLCKILITILIIWHSMRQYVFAISTHLFDVIGRNITIIWPVQIRHHHSIFFFVMVPKILS